MSFKVLKKDNTTKTPKPDDQLKTIEQPATDTTTQATAIKDPQFQSTERPKTAELPAPETPKVPSSAIPNLSEHIEASPSWDKHAQHAINVMNQQKQSQKFFSDFQNQILTNLQNNFNNLDKLSKKDIKNFFLKAPKESQTYKKLLQNQYRFDIIHHLSEFTEQNPANITLHLDSILEPDINTIIGPSNKVDDIEVLQRLHQKTPHFTHLNLNLNRFQNISKQLLWYRPSIVNHFTAIGLAGLEEFIKNNDISALEKIKPILAMPQTNYNKIWDFVEKTVHTPAGKLNPISDNQKKILMSTLSNSFLEKQKNWSKINNVISEHVSKLSEFRISGFKNWLESNNKELETVFKLNWHDVYSPILKDLDFSIELDNQSFLNVFKTLNDWTEEDKLNFLLKQKSPFVLTSLDKLTFDTSNPSFEDAFNNFLKFIDNNLNTVSKKYNNLDFSSKKNILASFEDYSTILSSLLTKKPNLKNFKFNVIKDFFAKHWQDENKREFLVPFIEKMDADAQSAFFKATDVDVLEEKDKIKFNNFKDLFTSDLLTDKFIEILNQPESSVFKTVLQKNLINNNELNVNPIFQKWNFIDLKAETQDVLQLSSDQKQQFLKWADDCFNYVNKNFSKGPSKIGLNMSNILDNFNLLNKNADLDLKDNLQNITNPFLKFLIKINHDQNLNPLEPYTTSDQDIVVWGKVFPKSLNETAKAWHALQDFWQKDLENQDITDSQWQTVVKNQKLLFSLPKPDQNVLYEPFQQKPVNNMQILNNVFKLLSKKHQTNLVDHLIHMIDHELNVLYNAEFSLNSVFQMPNEDFYAILNTCSSLVKMQKFFKNPNISKFFCNNLTFSQILNKINNLPNEQSNNAISFYKTILKSALLKMPKDTKLDTLSIMSLPWSFEELMISPKDVASMLVDPESKFLAEIQPRFNVSFDKFPIIYTMFDYLAIFAQISFDKIPQTPDIIMTLLSSASVAPEHISHFNEDQLLDVLKKNLFVFQTNPYLFNAVHDKINIWLQKQPHLIETANTFALVNQLPNSNIDFQDSFLRQLFNNLKNNFSTTSKLMFFNELKPQLSIDTIMFFSKPRFWQNLWQKHIDFFDEIIHFAQTVNNTLNCWDALKAHENVDVLVPEFIANLLNHYEFVRKNDLGHDKDMAKIFLDFSQNQTWLNNFLKLPPQKIALLLNNSDELLQQFPAMQSNLQNFILTNGDVFFSDEVANFVTTWPKWISLFYKSIGDIVKLDQLSLQEKLQVWNIPVMHKLVTNFILKQPTQFSISESTFLSQDIIDSSVQLLQKLSSPEENINKYIMLAIADTVYKQMFSNLQDLKNNHVRLEPFKQTFSSWPNDFQRDVILTSIQQLFADTPNPDKETLDNLCWFVNTLLSKPYQYQSPKKFLAIWTPIIERHPQLLNHMISSFETFFTQKQINQMLLSPVLKKQMAQQITNQLQHVNNISTVSELVDFINTFSYIHQPIPLKIEHPQYSVSNIDLHLRQLQLLLEQPLDASTIHYLTNHPLNLSVILFDVFKNSYVFVNQFKRAVDTADIAFFPEIVRYMAQASDILFQKTNQFHFQFLNSLNKIPDEEFSKIIEPISV
ncbi:MAG: hypothetical protein RMK17_02545, partial [bacterium]|nr:hypothetical protein [bacterium]